MSSAIGHGLAGLTAGIANRDSPLPTTSRSKWLWVGWLVLVAIAPDLDYFIPFLHPSSNAGLRITHSLFFASLLPALTLAWLRITGCDRQSLWRATFQLSLASFSHLGLDLLVGVTAIPIAWPLNSYKVVLPFGILPSAGQPRLSNYYFYRNLGIEMGVLLPLSCCWLIGKSETKAMWKWAIVGILLSISTYFMHWAYGLSR